MPLSPHLTFTREEWKQYRSDVPLTLLENELEALRGFNERVSLDEVGDIYLPLARLINLYVGAAQSLYQVSAKFLDTHVPKVPYIIGISGSVAVGKSTVSRVLQALLSRWPNSPEVEWVTTDGFLLPNEVLEKRGLMERKGFPESYDRKALIQFLMDVKSGKREAKLPLYSHEQYDILPNVTKSITQPDILIVEGLNILQVTQHDALHTPKIFISDLLDFSIYVDAPEDMIEEWYLNRFMAFREQAKNNSQLFFHRFAQLSDEAAYLFAKEVWQKINLANLHENIKPFKHRARLILEKTNEHRINRVHLRRL